MELGLLGQWLMQIGEVVSSGPLAHPPPPSLGQPIAPGLPHLLGITVWGLTLLLGHSLLRGRPIDLSHKLIGLGLGIGLVREIAVMVFAAMMAPGVDRRPGPPLLMATEVWCGGLAAILLTAGFLMYLVPSRPAGRQLLKVAGSLHCVALIGLVVVALVTGPIRPGFMHFASLITLMSVPILAQVVGGLFAMHLLSGVSRWLMVAATFAFMVGGAIRLLSFARLVPALMPPVDMVLALTAAKVGVLLYVYLFVRTHSAAMRSNFEALEEGVRKRGVELESVLEDLSVANSKLAQQSRVDALTGVYNRRHFDQNLYVEWARASREQLPLALAVVDVDQFKEINDRFGHPMGDECLLSVATSLQAHAQRPGDLVARYGGDEFVILMPNTNESGAAAALELARDAVDQLDSERGPNISISVGIASCVPEAGIVPENLIRRADKRLYEAKAGGRNRVVFGDTKTNAVSVG